MERSDLAKKLALVSTLAALLLAPGGSSETPAKIGLAKVTCAAKTCCPEQASLCIVNEQAHYDYYFTTEPLCS